MQTGEVVASPNIEKLFDVWNNRKLKIQRL